MILLVLISILGIFLAIIYFYKKQFQFWSKHGFPHSTPSIPYGNMKGIFTQKSIAEVAFDLHNLKSDEQYLGIWFYFRPVLLVRDPELIKAILVRDFMTFHDRGIYNNTKDDPLSGNLLSIAGTDWRNIRVKLTPTFTSGKMKMMFPIFVECSKKLKSVLDGPAMRGEVIEVKDFAARFTTDIISLAAFGISTDSLHRPDCDFLKYGKQIFEPTIFESFKGVVRYIAPNMAKFFSMRIIPKEIADFFLGVFRECMEYRETHSIKKKDFLDLLIQLKNMGKLEDVDEDSKDNTKFTYEEAAAQAFLFFLGGFETSSTTMQFLLYELAKNPDIQQRVRQEIKDVIAKYNGEVTYDGATETVYLGRIIDETLRMYPPATFLQRKSNKDFPIPGTSLILPKGILVLIDIMGLQRDPKYYPNPEIFDPDRFTEEKKSVRHNYSYIPFGEGPRNCIGMRFGLMQAKVGIMALLANYEFSVCKDTLIPMVFEEKALILTPKNGIRLKITKL